MSNAAASKFASALVPGDLVAERDGAFFQVTGVSPAPRGRIAVTLANVNGYRSAAPSMTVTVKASARINIVPVP